MNSDLLEQLLYEEESDSLDFKRDQYKFVVATDDEKSEFLKDILAFANSWCRTDAYILIGVKEIKGGRSQIVGITDHLDDASLQQFVNKKLNRPITFSYKAHTVTEGTIAIVTIPRQQRPFYLNKDYGRLKAKTVYVRRGSSTDEASLDEISKMGQVLGKPTVDTSLNVELADARVGTLLGKHLQVRSNVLHYDAAAIPFYSRSANPLGIALPGSGGDNRVFYKEYAEYERKTALLSGVRFVVTNTGSTLLQNVTIKIDFELEEDLLIVDNDDFPEKPKRRLDILAATFVKNLHSPFVPRRSVRVSKLGKHVTIVGKMLDIQAKDDVRSADAIYFGGRSSGEIAFTAKVFADNLGDPLQFDFIVSVEAIPGELATDVMIARLEASNTSK